MADDKEEKEHEFSSSYDYFYYDFSILNTLFDLKKVEIYASSELHLSFKDNIRGASYLFELILIDIIDHLEGLVENYNVGDILQWSHSNIKEEAIRKLIDSDPVI